MQWQSKVVGPSSSKSSARCCGTFRRLVACVCLLCFLSAVIVVADSHFSVRKSQDGGHNCKILRGCLDSEDESRRVPTALIVESSSEIAIPVLQVLASVAAEAVVPLRMSSLTSEQGRAPPFPAA